MNSSLPSHLAQYSVQQDYSRYTPIDQAAWRHIMRQLQAYLSVHAHPIYADGLKKTGITIDRIPKISEISEHLEKFGWRAIPVSGFIPPAAFMELQAHGVLPIASDMRSVEHLMYTPAPDIVHEAAGHAPILVDPEFAAYLKQYAQVARRAIVSKKDMDQYDAIRLLSDIKEDPGSSKEEIQKAEKTLEQINQSLKFVSEAALLGRMNWWTAEYGLIGKLEKPKIFGAGLLSSVGESKTCLSSHVKKIPLTADCVQYSYDITEPQPQLFVTPNFGHLGDVLEDLAKQMAFRRGGRYGLDRAIESETINTVELNSGIQISGRLTNYLKDSETDDPCYLQFTGPTQLCFESKQIPHHGTKTHAAGFGTPVGMVSGWDRCLSQVSEAEFKKAQMTIGQIAHLKFKSGVEVKGRLIQLLYRNEKLVLMSFQDCEVKRGNQILFQPAWGVFDMAVGSQIPSVFGGPADREQYGEVESFPVRHISPHQFAASEKKLHHLYQEVRDLRAQKADAQTALTRVFHDLESHFPSDWLLTLEIYELSLRLHAANLQRSSMNRLETLACQLPEMAGQIQDGIRLCHAQV